MSWIAAAALGVGAATTVVGDIRAHNAQKKLQNATSPAYTPSQSIGDYYSKALARYNINPYQNPVYQQQLQSLQQQQATALNNLQGARQGLAGAAGISYATGQGTLGATSAAQQQQSQELAQLGGAAGAQTGQTTQAFDINSMQPFVRNYNLLAMKAGGANQVTNAGISSVNSGLNSYAQQMALQKYFGQQQNGGSVPNSYALNAGSLLAQQPNPTIPMLQNPANY